jgi:aspartate kinase
MKKITAKFGGSSLASAAQFRKVGAILAADPDRRFVVASAPGKRDSGDTKVTDLLYRCYDLAAAGEEYLPVLDAIRARFADIAGELGASFDVEAELAPIREHLAAAPRRDYMASRGEYLNSRLLAAWLGWPFVDAASCVRFRSDGSFDADATQTLLSQALSGLDRAVVPGFYGADETGRVVTFSRGGSDVSGSLVARAVGADLYENWTDVSGVLFTDPRIVKNPIPIPYITYRELRELSYMGASVLHEDAVFPVRRAGIPINIRNTNRPEDPGTMIVAALPEGVTPPPVTGVAGRKGFSSVLVEKSMMNAEVGFGARLLDIFAEKGVPFEHCPTGIDTMSVVVSESLFTPHKAEVLAAVEARLKPDSVKLEEGLAMIAVVGCGMVANKGIAARILGAVTAAGVNIRMIDQGSSELNIILGIDAGDYETAVRGIYREFYGK